MAIVALAYYHDSVAGVFVHVGDSLAAPGGPPPALAAPDTAGGGGETATRLVRLFTGGAPACPAPSNGRPCR